MDQYITVKEAATRKNVTESTIYRAIREQRLAATTVLGRIALRPEDVDACEFGSYLANKRTIKPRGIRTRRKMTD